MGQKASPISNKLGVNLFWDNLWEDKINFSRKLKEDIFINMFFFLVFNKSFLTHTTSIKNLVYFYQTLPKNKYTYLYNNFWKLMTDKEISNFLIRYKIYYMGRIWVLRFQGWCCVIFHLYMPQIIKEQTYNQIRKTKNRRHFKINQLNTLIKTNYIPNNNQHIYPYWISKINNKSKTGKSPLFQFTF